MITKSRQEQKTETCEKLYAAAVELFARKGLEKTSPQDIAALAGVSVGSFYTHFENKYALLEQIVLNYSNDMTKSVEAAIAATEFRDLESLARTHYKALIDYNDRHPQLSILWTSYKSYTSKETDRITDEAAERHLRALYNKHFHSTDLNQELAVQAQIGMVTRLVSWWNMDRTRTDADSLVEMLVRAAVDGVYAVEK